MEENFETVLANCFKTISIMFPYLSQCPNTNFGEDLMIIPVGDHVSTEMNCDCVSIAESFDFRIIEMVCSLLLLPEERSVWPVLVWVRIWSTC